MNSFSDHCVDRAETSSLKWDRYKGRDILPFWLADMDFRSSPAIIEALRKRVEHGVFGYTLPDERLYEAVLGYLHNDKGLKAERDWIVWLPGIVPGLGASCRAFAGPGEGVMYCPPVYPQFMLAPVNQGRKGVRVPLARAGMSYSFDWEAMEKAARGVKLLLICNPHNPIGRAFSRSELERLGSFAARHGIIICSDDIHCDLVLDPEAVHTPILAIEEAAARSVMLMAPSKTFNVPGLSCAFAVIPDKGLRDSFKRAIRGMADHVNLMGFEACRAAYAESGAWLKGLLGYLRENRATLRRCIAERMPEIKIGPCEATYMAWLDVSELGLDDPVRYFEDAGVGLSDGADYGERQMLRMNFACPSQMLEEGLERMARAVDALREPVGPKSCSMQ